MVFSLQSLHIRYVFCVKAMSSDPQYIPHWLLTVWIVLKTWSEYRQMLVTYQKKKNGIVKGGNGVKSGWMWTCELWRPLVDKSMTHRPLWGAATCLPRGRSLSSHSWSLLMGRAVVTRRPETQAQPRS